MRAWISVITAITLLTVTACTAPERVIRRDTITMKELLERRGVGQNTQHVVRQKSAELELDTQASNEFKDLESYTTTAEKEIEQLFPVLPNPSIKIYVYPHMATSTRAPVPGYTTVIKLYERDEYALPNESLR